MSIGNQTISQAIVSTINQYFTNLDGEHTSDLYQLVISQVEKPLLETILQKADYNQSKAAKWLGISRNTLRKLIAKHMPNLGKQHANISEF